jgi:hypothetical protein
MAHSPFLLDGPLRAYLQELHATGFRLNQQAKLLRNDAAWASQFERHSRAAQLGQDRLVFANRIDNLAAEFARFLQLSDFARSKLLSRTAYRVKYDDKPK